LWKEVETPIATPPNAIHAAELPLSEATLPTLLCVAGYGDIQRVVEHPPAARSSEPIGAMRRHGNRYASTQSSACNILCPMRLLDLDPEGAGAASAEGKAVSQ
jgi:hypothetical protein